MANSGTLANAARIMVRPVPVARPITAVPIGRPIATTEPNAISRMIIAASRPISSDVPVSGCVPHDAYSPPISISSVGRAAVLEDRLERLERLDAQIDGRFVVGDLCVSDRAVGATRRPRSRTGS